MDSSKIKNALEVGTNVAVLLAAMMVVAVLAGSFLSNRTTQAQKENTKPPPPQFQKGEILPQVDGLDYNAAPRTLMIAMSTECKFCLASVPFYTRIAEVVQPRAGSLRVVAVFPNASEDVARFIQDSHFPLETLANRNLDNVGLRHTPTLVLVDQSGAILNMWVGMLTPDGENNVLENLSGSAVL